MKIKELKQILNGLNDDLIVYLFGEGGKYPLQLDEVNKVKIKEKEVLLIG